MIKELPRPAKPYTQNSCRLCAPLGACLVYKGIKNCLPLLHGSQGCATYIRRYLISHFRDPVDIASSSFSEETAIYGGQKNLETAVKNAELLYQPEVIGIASTCLSETIGDDVPRIIKNLSTPGRPAELIYTSTPSYQKSHYEGFLKTLRSVVEIRAQKAAMTGQLNLFCAMFSPADIRQIKDLLADWKIPAVVFPDYSDTLDSGAWDQYHALPEGGTPLAHIDNTGASQFSISFINDQSPVQSAGKMLEEKFAIPSRDLLMPIGLGLTDAFFNALSDFTGKPVPVKYTEERSRLIDAYTDAHKYLFGKKAVLYGEEDLVLAMASFLLEIGMVPLLLATGSEAEGFCAKAKEILEDTHNTAIMTGADFDDLDFFLSDHPAELLLGSSKGYKLSEKYSIPLLRTGFPIHDRFGAQRQRAILYSGTQELFDRIVNIFLENAQQTNPIGYTYL